MEGAMANTEILKALKDVRQAQAEVNAALKRKDLSDGERDLLEDRRTFLLDLDDVLLHTELSSNIAKLKSRSQKLAKLNAETQKKLDRLAKVAKAIERTAKVIDALVKAASILAKVGLV
jgi:hypothetical protein